jgi:integrase
MASSRERLTKRLIEQAEIRPKAYLLHDADVRGFACKITPAGRRVYLLFYRTRDGQQRRPAIGLHGSVTVEQARATARVWLADVIKGGDPSHERQLGRQAATIADLGQKFLAEYSAVHKKPSSHKEDRRIIRKHLNPALGTRKVTAVTRADIHDLQHKLKSTPYEANRVLAFLSKMFNMAEAWGLRPDGSNPVRHVRRFPEKKRERFLTHDELTRIGRVLRQMEIDRPETLGVVHAIKLLALTGCRVGEILGLRWDWIDRDVGVIRLPEAKAGARNVPLSDAAMAVLDAIPRKDQPWIIVNATGDRPLAKPTIEHAWARIRVQAELGNARLHDFRHTVGTYGGQAGFNAFTIRDLLGHKTLAMTGRYVEQDVAPMRAAANAVSDRIVKQLLGVTIEFANDNRSADALVTAAIPDRS